MGNKSKYIVLMLIVSTSFVLMQSINPVGSLGDHLLGKIGIRAWSGENEGLHIGLIYFMTIFIIGLGNLKDYRMKIKLSKFKSFILFVIIVLILNIGVIEGYKIVKSNSKGLLSIGFDSNDSLYSISHNRRYL